MGCRDQTYSWYLIGSPDCSINSIEPTVYYYVWEKPTVILYAHLLPRNNANMVIKNVITKGLSTSSWRSRQKKSPSLRQRLAKGEIGPVAVFEIFYLSLNTCNY